MAPIPSRQTTRMATISADTLLNTSKHDKEMLIDIYELLNNLFARNRNQHRRSHWWKSLHAFRKQLALLLSEMDTGKKSERPTKIEARLKYWDEKCVHTWYWCAACPSCSRQKD
jgi:ribonuclease MRP protein subunit RMP1